MHTIQAGETLFEAVRKGRWYVARARNVKTGETTVLKQYNYDIDGRKAELAASKLIAKHAKVAKRALPT